MIYRQEEWLRLQKGAWGSRRGSNWAAGRWLDRERVMGEEGEGHPFMDGHRAMEDSLSLTHPGPFSGLLRLWSKVLPEHLHI